MPIDLSFLLPSFETKVVTLLVIAERQFLHKESLLEII